MDGVVCISGRSGVGLPWSAAHRVPTGYTAHSDGIKVGDEMCVNVSCHARWGG